MTATPLTSNQGAARAGDKIFSGAALAAGCLILAVLFGVALFLVVQAIPALTAPAAGSRLPRWRQPSPTPRGRR